MSDPVKVFCKIPNGVSLRLVKPFDDGTGGKQQYPYGDPVILGGPRSPGADFSQEPVATDVAPEFWSKWLEQNKDSSLVTEQMVYVKEPEKRGA